VSEAESGFTVMGGVLLPIEFSHSLVEIQVEEQVKDGMRVPKKIVESNAATIRA
jgi:hypothetical protein